jgi:hypothetical protein
VRRLPAGNFRRALRHDDNERPPGLSPDFREYDKPTMTVTAPADYSTAGVRPGRSISIGTQRELVEGVERSV